MSFQGTTFHGKASFKGAVFAGSADFRNAEWISETATAEFQDTVVENPETTSPEVDASSSIWPDGWCLDTTGDHATLKRS
ncbi:pentapeptide repeat-containing protein [Lentzea sp. NPDC054927]